jgi:hypothetical protein
MNLCQCITGSFNNILFFHIIKLVEGDYTATVHVEGGMWLNIDFNDSAVLSFSVAVYPVSTITSFQKTYWSSVAKRLSSLTK